MTDPRTPPTREAQLPDPLDQTPAEARPDEELQPRGSEDAQLLSEAESGETEVEAADVQADD